MATFTPVPVCTAPPKPKPRLIITPEDEVIIGCEPPEPVAPPTPAPVPENSLIILKAAIQNLWRDRRRNKFELGEKLLELQTKYSRPHTGTFSAHLQELHIPRYEAYRAIKFYRRVKACIESVANCNRLADSKWGGVEDVEEIERLDRLANADKLSSELQALADPERQRAAEALEKRKTTVSGYRVILKLSEEERKQFTKAWNSLDEERRSRLVFDAVCQYIGRTDEPTSGGYGQ